MEMAPTSGTRLPAYQSAASIRSLAGYAVRVSGVDHGDARRPLRDETGGVSHSLPGRQIAQRDDARAQRQAGLDGQPLPHFLPLLRRIERLVIAVENRAGPNHVRIGAGARANRAAIGQMHDSRRDAQFAHAVEALLKTALLIVCLSRAEIFRRRKVSKRAFQLDVPAVGQRFAKASISSWRYPEAVHAGIDLQMKRHPGFCAHGFRGALKMAHVFQTRDRGRQAILDESLLFSWPKTGENQDALSECPLREAPRPRSRR